MCLLPSTDSTLESLEASMMIRNVRLLFHMSSHSSLLFLVCSNRQVPDDRLSWCAESSLSQSLRDEIPQVCHLSWSVVFSSSLFCGFQ